MTPELPKTLELFLPDEAATLGLGEAIAQALPSGLVVFLEGDLGAGKTTLSRGVLRGLGHDGSVKSPTYTLVEVYELPERVLYHFDLYRLGDPGELEYLGIRDYLEQGAAVLVEWPGRGGSVLPDPDLVVALTPEQDGRRVRLTAHTEAGLGTLAHVRL